MQLLPPQSDEDVRPVVEALRRLDGLLDVRWEPKAQLEKRAEFNAFGVVSKAAEYSGRWQIIRWNTDRLHLEREYAVILTVTAIDESTPARLMMKDGAYAPVGEWVVEYMARFDAAQNRFADEMEKVWAEHERAEDLSALINDHAAHQEGAERVYREHGGGEYWMGGAQGKSDPVTERALWPAAGKGRRSSDALASISSSTTP